MPVNPAVSLKDATNIRKTIERLADRAREDLEDAISCAVAAVDSDRYEFLADCGMDFLRCSERKVRMAIDLARLTASCVPEPLPSARLRAEPNGLRARDVPELVHVKEEGPEGAPDNSGSVVES